MHLPAGLELENNAAFIVKVNKTLPNNCVLGAPDLFTEQFDGVSIPTRNRDRRARGKSGA